MLTGTEKKLVVTIGKGYLKVQTISYKINKSQDCNTQHREYNQYFIITLKTMYRYLSLNQPQRYLI